MGFKQTKSYLRISLFAAKVAIGIFGLASDIIYFYTEEFKIIYIKDIMAFFILLSPLIQVLAWGILLSEIKMKIPEPQEDERVKNSKTLFQYIFNYLYCFIIYYLTVFKSMIKLLPQTIFIALLQETKIFPVFLFGYTYLKYQAVLTADLMRNISSYLELQESKENGQQKQQQKERAIQNVKSDFHIEQKQNNQQILGIQKENIEVVDFDQSNLSQITNNYHMASNQDQQEKNNIQNKILTHSPSLNIFKKMFENSRRNQLKVKKLIQTKFSTINTQFQQQQAYGGNSDEVDISEEHIQSNQNLPLNQLKDPIAHNFNHEHNSKNTLFHNGKVTNQDNYLKSSYQSINNKYNSGYSQQEQNEEGINKFGFSQIDVTLDANLLPTIDTLLIDKNLQQFILITDVVKAIFGALPMTIVKYLNNNLNDRWKTSQNNIDYFILFSFLISLLTILTHGIQLMGILYNDNIKIYYKTLQYLSNMQEKERNSSKNHLRKQKIEDNDIQIQQIAKNQKLLESQEDNNQFKQNKFFGFGKLFPMMKILKINSQQQIKKLNMLRQQACDEVKCMQYNLSNHTFIAANLQKNLKQSLGKFKNLQKLVIKFNNNYFGDGIEDVVKVFLSSMPFLRNIQLSYYSNPFKEEQIESIFLLINDWMTNNQNQNVSVLFETELAFIWYPSQIEVDENPFLFLDKLQEMQLGQNKFLFSVNIPQKTILDDEAVFLSKQIQGWNNLQKFQLNCQELSTAGQEMIKQSIQGNQQIKNYQFSSQKNGMICSKGYEFNTDLKKGQIQIQNQNFFFSSLGAYLLMNREIKDQWKIYLHTLDLNFQQELPNSEQCLCESEIKSLFNNISQLKFIKSFTLNLKNNNLGDTIGSIISQSLIQLPKLKDLCVNFEGNRLTKIGFKDFISEFVKQKKSLESLELNLNGCQIHQDGAALLSNYFKMLKDQEEAVGSKNQFDLQRLMINLTKSRVNQKAVDSIFQSISQLQSLQYVNIIIKGIQLSNINQFDLSRLVYLKELHLTLWQNQFSKDGFINLANSFETFPSSIQQIYLDLSHNEIKPQVYPFLDFLNKNNNIFEFNLNLDGNSSINYLPNIQEILMDQQRILMFKINLSCCDFDYNSVLQLKQGLMFLVNLKVIWLDFSKNKKFDDDCFLAINHVLSELKTLEEIQYYCQETQITNASIEAFSYQLQTFKKVETLTVDFSQNNIDETMKNLVRQSLIKAKKILHPSLVI